MMLLGHRYLSAFGAAFWVLSALAACRRPPGELHASPPDFEGQVVGSGYELVSKGRGGLAQLTVAVGERASRLFTRAHVWIDSATKFVVTGRDSVDWAMPQLRNAYVRVWFRGSPSTPNNDEIWGKADRVAIDSIRARAAVPPAGTDSTLKALCATPPETTTTGHVGCLLRDQRVSPTPSPVIIRKP